MVDGIEPYWWLIPVSFIIRTATALHFIAAESSIPQARTVLIEYFTAPVDALFERNYKFESSIYGEAINSIWKLFLETQRESGWIIPGIKN